MPPCVVSTTHTSPEGAYVRHIDEAALLVHMRCIHHHHN